MDTTRAQRYGWLMLLVLLASCAQAPVATAPQAPARPSSHTELTWLPPAAPAPDSPHVQPAEQALAKDAVVSQANTAKEYRADAARHLYNTYQRRIYKGKMPPMLKAVGVIEVAVNSRGGVDDIVWLRAPRHVPEVMREIEQQVRAAAPYPAPVRMKQVKYTDTWLWHASGQFQLDTLTEGQY